MSQYKKGVEGEEIAEKYLNQKGYVTLERRYRGFDGEIDLIMMDGDCLVFVEVKLRRKGQAGDGLYAVTKDKMRRLTHAATAFIMEKGWADRLCRFDVVEVNSTGIIHIPNAFNEVR